MTSIGRDIRRAPARVGEVRGRQHTWRTQNLQIEPIVREPWIRYILDEGYVIGKVDEDGGCVDCGTVAFLILPEHAKHLPHARHVGSVEHLDCAAPIILWTAGTICY